MKIPIPLLVLAFGFPFQVPATPLDSPDVVVQQLHQPGSPPSGPVCILPTLESGPSEESKGHLDPSPEGADQLPVLCACLFPDALEGEALDTVGLVLA
jgi:hypothetical protein